MLFFFKQNKQPRPQRICSLQEEGEKDFLKIALGSRLQNKYTITNKFHLISSTVGKRNGCLPAHLLYYSRNVPSKLNTKMIIVILLVDANISFI